MSRIANVILSYGGTVALPLFLWLIVVVAIFLIVLAGVPQRLCQRVCSRVRLALVGLLLVVWTLHSGFIIYTCSQIYSTIWLTKWQHGSEPTLEMIYNVVGVCLIMKLLAGVLLLCASFLAVWDMKQRFGPSR